MCKCKYKNTSSIRESKRSLSMSQVRVPLPAFSAKSISPGTGLEEDTEDAAAAEDTEDATAAAAEDTEAAEAAEDTEDADTAEEADAAEEQDAEEGIEGCDEGAECAGQRTSASGFSL